MSEPTATPDPLHVGAGWYVGAFVVYVALGLALKSVVLNWIVGPLFLVATVEVLPRAVGATRRSRR